MSPFKVIYVCVVFIFLSLAISHAANRDLIIQKQMNCVDTHLQKNSLITWNDVCDMPETSNPQHLQMVNQEMDQIQRSEKASTLSNSPAHAIIEYEELTPKAIHRKSSMSFEIAPEISYITYREPSVHVKEYGAMAGINGIFTYRPPVGSALNSKISNMYRVEGRFSYGKIKYDGGLSDGTPYSFNCISDYMLEFRGLIGKDYFFNGGSTSFTPYFGGGYRHLFDAFYAAKPGGYNRRIQYVYIPLGTEIMTNIGKGWAIGGDAEYDFFINGTVTSYLGNIGYGNVTNTQKHGFGLKGSIKLVKKMDHFNLILEPYLRYWHIRNSKVAASDPFSYNGSQYVFVGQEPNNNSTEIGGKLGIEF